MSLFKTHTQLRWDVKPGHPFAKQCAVRVQFYFWICSILPSFCASSHAIAPGFNFVWPFEERTSFHIQSSSGNFAFPNSSWKSFVFIVRLKDDQHHWGQWNPHMISHRVRSYHTEFPVRPLIPWAGFSQAFLDSRIRTSLGRIISQYQTFFTKHGCLNVFNLIANCFETLHSCKNERCCENRREWLSCRGDNRINSGTRIRARLSRSHSAIWSRASDTFKRINETRPTGTGLFVCSSDCHSFDPSADLSDCLDSLNLFWQLLRVAVILSYMRKTFFHFEMTQEGFIDLWK